MAAPAWGPPSCWRCLTLCLLGLVELASSQSLLRHTGPCVENGINSSVCCSRIEFEAMEACLEYGLFGFDAEYCKAWEVEAGAKCRAECRNCTVIADNLRDQCEFALQFLGNGPQIKRYCAGTFNDFKNYRCPTACKVNETDCTAEEGQMCMEYCGNYRGCSCRQNHGSSVPDECFGETVLKGELPGRPGLNYSCGLTGNVCRHHRPPKEDLSEADLALPKNIGKGFGGICGQYKYCAPDLCLIKNISCPSPHQCIEEGQCESATGLCFYTNRPAGYPCDDDTFYTLNDTCDDGLCSGRTDYCMKYNVTCVPMDTCIVSGSCDPDSGRCSYIRKPEGTPCDDKRDYTVEDRCESGLCVGRPIDLCYEAGVVCKVPNVCFDAGICDPRTGECSAAVPSTEKRGCDDGDPTTNNDTCIDGVCLGRPVDGTSSAKFLTLGTGECTDRDQRRMARYAGDIEEGEQECEAVCRGDPQCAAYGYAFPLCSIYGTVRMRPPEDGRKWFFQAGSEPPAVAIEQASSLVTGQRGAICRRKGTEEDTEETHKKSEVSIDDIFGPMQLTGFFFAVIFCFLALPFYRALRFCIFGGDQVKEKRSLFGAAPSLGLQRFKTMAMPKAKTKELPPPQDESLVELPSNEEDLGGSGAKGKWGKLRIVGALGGLDASKMSEDPYPPALTDSPVSPPGSPWHSEMPGEMPQAPLTEEEREARRKRQQAKERLLKLKKVTSGGAATSGAGLSPTLAIAALKASKGAEGVAEGEGERSPPKPASKMKLAILKAAAQASTEDAETPAEAAKADGEADKAKQRADVKANLARMRRAQQGASSSSALDKEDPEKEEKEEEKREEEQKAKKQNDTSVEEAASNALAAGLMTAGMM